MSQKLVIANPDFYPDILMGSIVATKEESPLLYCGKDGLSSEVNQLIAKRDIRMIVLISSADHLSGEIEKVLHAKGIEVEWIKAEDEFELSVIIAKDYYKIPTEFLIVNPEFTADAINAPSLSFQLNAPILFVKKDDVPEIVGDYLYAVKVLKYHFFGDEEVLSAEVEKELQKYA